MENPTEELNINGIIYVPKSSVNPSAPSLDGMKLVLVRGSYSGVQFGYAKDYSGGPEIELINSRRIWSWNNATETNQIAVYGIGNESKVTLGVPYKCINDAIEVIDISNSAAKNLLNQPVWKK